MLKKISAYFGIIAFGYIFAGVGPEHFINNTVIDGRVPVINKQISFQAFCIACTFGVLLLILSVLLKKEASILRDERQKNRDINLNSI